MNLDDLLGALDDGERREFETILTTTRNLWTPDRDNAPQCAAYTSRADVLGFGGAAGGGKTELGLGLALTQHRKSIVFRQSSVELPAIVDRLAEIFGSREGFNGQKNIWRFKRFDGVDAQIELGSFHNVGDEQGYRGRPHDLIVFDEASNMREFAVRFLQGWLRSVVPGQRKRVVLSFNPPTDIEGRWIVRFFAPWLDKQHPNPAAPGELRWFVVVDGKDVEVPDDRQCVLLPRGDGTHEIRYTFDPKQFSRDQIVTPLSRTFIPSRVIDNKYLRDTGYVAQLQGLPEPLRSQQLYGDFSAGVEDDAFQVIPTAWVEAAMARWRRPSVLQPMESVGVDVALGKIGEGRDDTVIMSRHGEDWFDMPAVHPSAECKDGPTVAGFVVARVRDRAVIHIDVFGSGARPYGHLMQIGQHVVAVQMGEVTAEKDEAGVLGFFNTRSLIWWRMREALDPAARVPVALPPVPRLLAELCAPKWAPVAGKVKVQSREEMLAKLGHSPDMATACVLANMRTPRLAADGGLLAAQATVRRVEHYSPIRAPRYSPTPNRTHGS